MEGVAQIKMSSGTSGFWPAFTAEWVAYPRLGNNFRDSPGREYLMLE